MEKNIVKLEDLTKATLSEMVATVISEAIEEGLIDPVDAFAKATALEFLGKNIKQGLKEAVTDGLIGEKQSTIKRNGVRVTLAEKKVYQYDHCEAWKSRKLELDEIQKLMKATPSTVAFEDTGEMINPVKVKYTQNVLSCELPK